MKMFHGVFCLFIEYSVPMISSTFGIDSKLEKHHNFSHAQTEQAKSLASSGSEKCDWAVLGTSKVWRRSSSWRHLKPDPEKSSSECGYGQLRTSCWAPASITFMIVAS